MTKILKINEVKMENVNGKMVARYIFNDDKIIRVNMDDDEIITKNAPKEHQNLISIYIANHHTRIKKREIIIEEEVSTKKNDKSQDKIQIIKSGKGAGLGVFLGFLSKMTIIGPVIAGFCSFQFFEDICDKKYLEKTDAKEINFRKGFYASSIFGWIVAIECCNQWKDDIISVLEGEPNRISKKGHVCFKIWFMVELFYWAFSLATNIAQIK